MNKVKRYIDACHTCLKTKMKYMKNQPVYGRIPVDYAPMQDLLIDIKTMPQVFGGYHLLLVITCDRTTFTISVPLSDQTAQTVAEALIYRVIYLFGPPRQIICDEATEFSSAIIQTILCMLNCRLKVISPYNHGSSNANSFFFFLCKMLFAGSLVPRCALVWGMVVRGFARQDLC